MASRKPLVLTSGEPRQLQTGDILVDGDGNPIKGSSSPIAVSGTQDGSNKVFTLASAINAGTELVFFNGQKLTSGSSNDYLVSGTTLTFQAAFPAPISTDRIEVYAAPTSTGGYTLTQDEHDELQLGLISGGGRYEQDLIVTQPRTVIDYVRVEGNLRLENELRIQPSDLGTSSPTIVTPGSDRLFDQLLATPQSTFDITNIVQNFLHLRLVFYLRGTAVADGADFTIRFNNDSGNNYDSERSIAFGASSAIGGADAGNTLDLFACPQSNSDAGSFAAGELIIPNYTATTGHKTVSGFSFAYYSSARNQFISGGRWRSFAAINRITVSPPSANWATGCRMTCYGLR